MHRTYQIQGHAAALGALLPQITTNRPGKSPNLLPPANGTIHTECRIFKHVVASATEAEFGGLFHNGQTAVPLWITLHELGFTQPPTSKKKNSTAEVIVTASVRKKNQGNWHAVLLDEGKGKAKRTFCLSETRKPKHRGLFQKNITHHITIGKFVLCICIWQMNYLKSIITSFTNGPMMCSRQSIRLQSRQSIHMQSCKTVMFYQGVLMSYVRMDTKIPKRQCSMYERGSTWKPIRNKDGQTRSRSLNELKTRSTRGRIYYLW